MAQQNIIPQGEQARFIVKSNRADFSFDESDYSLEIIYGMNGQRIVIEKDDFVKEGNDWTIRFSTSGMVGSVLARLTVEFADEDCALGIRPEVDDQYIGFVTTSPCTRLHQCPACGGDHIISYTYINNGE
jgi:hypothetical protein